MAFTQFKKLSAQAYNTNNNAWGANGSAGVDLNTGLISLVDYALAGVSTFTNPSGAISLSFTAGGGGDVQNALWSFTGTITADTTITTAVGDATTYLNGLYCWSNTTSGSKTLTLTTANGSVVMPQGRRGFLYVNNVNSVAPFIVAMVGSGSADPIPAGTVMLFYQNAAPAGWTISSSLNDYALKIVSSAGGVTSGSVAYSTLFGRTATDGYSLLAADIPSHQHFIANADALGSFASLTASNSLAYSANEGNSFNYSLCGSATTPTIGLSSASGGGGSHSHAIDMRVLTASVILASRN